MSFAFELHFDEQTETAVRAAWTWLAARGFDTSRNGVAPHVTLAIASAFASQSLEVALRAFAQEHPPFPVAFGEVDSFPGGIPFLPAVATPPLLAIHRAFHDRFASLARAPNSHYYLPGQWVPHCTLAMSLPDPRVLTGMPLEMPGASSFQRLRVVEYPSPKMHLDCPLGRS